MVPPGPRSPVASKKEFPMNDLRPYQQTMLATWQQHTHAEFELKDADAALATMTENPYVLAIPSGTRRHARREYRVSKHC